MERGQKAGFLSLRSSKITVTKEKESRKRKSEEKKRRRKKKAMVALLGFIIATKGPFGDYKCRYQKFGQKYESRDRLSVRPYCPSTTYL